MNDHVEAVITHTRWRAMKSDRSKIAHLPLRPQHTGGVICLPLNLRFPTVYRIVQSTTREQLDELGLPDDEPFAGAHHYTLFKPGDDTLTFPGTIDRTAIQRLDPAIPRPSTARARGRRPTGEAPITVIIGGPQPRPRAPRVVELGGQIEI